MGSSGRRVGTCTGFTLVLWCATAFAQAPLGWYPLRGRELPWTFEPPSSGPISVDSSSLENGVWKIQVTLKDGQVAGKAWGGIGVTGTGARWEKSKLKIDLRQAPVFSFRMRCTQRDARGVHWYFNAKLGFVDENGKVIGVWIGGVNSQVAQGEWVTRTVNLHPFYLKFPRAGLVGLGWQISGDLASPAGAKVFRAEVADVMVRAQTPEEKTAEMRDPFLRQMRERKPLPAPHLTDRFWMGLWGAPFNNLGQSHEGTREVSGRDMLAHHVEVMICGGPGSWSFCETQKPQLHAEEKSTLDLYCERLKDWLDDQCRPFDLKAIPDISSIAEHADEDPNGFKANMDGVMATFAKEPLIVGWDGAEESDASRAREYLTAQFAIEDRNPHQPMAAFGGDINALHRFIHVYYAGCGGKPRDVGDAMRDAWRYEPPAVWAGLSGSVFSGGSPMPTPAETRLRNHLCLAWGAGGIIYWRYGAVLPYGSPAGDQSLVDPFCNPSPTWTEYGQDAPVCIRIGATTCLMRRDEQASAALQKAQAAESPKLAWFVLRPRKPFASEARPDPNSDSAKRLRQLAGSTVVLVVNTDTDSAVKARPDLAPIAGSSTFYTFPGGKICPTTGLARARDAVELAPGGIAGWLWGSGEQARAANLAGDRALYLNSVRLPRYDIVFAKRWKADVAAAEALLAKAEQAFAAGDYAAALDSQAQAEAEAQRALAAQPDYAAVTPGLNEIKASLGQVVTRIRDARVAGRVKDDDPIAKGQGLAATFAGLGIRYNRDLLPAWVKGASPQLRNDVEKLRKGVVELQAAMDKELGPPTR